MSDYYYIRDKESEVGFTPVLGEDYIHALKTIAERHGVKVTDEMILKEVFGKHAVLKKRKKKGKAGIGV